jgi:ribonuclease P protein component
MADQCLRRIERLRRPSEYQRVFRHGKKLVAPMFVLYILSGSEPYSRLGMAVSKRVGNAVIRNHVKRLIRELFRQHKTQLQPSCDVVFVARRQAAEASLGEYTQQFLMLLRRYQQAAEKK